jgi:murein DD-endopeptidase MepM/ murein hydrolase activator NlpD
VTSQVRYGSSNQKPIRKDRVLIAVLVVVAIVILIILLRSGCTRREAGDLVVVEDDQTAAAAQGTTGENVDAVVGQILNAGNGTSTSASSGTTAGTQPTTLPGDVLQHTVQDGESLQDVATAMGVTVRVLRASNNLYGSEQLQPGQVLVASRAGILDTIRSGQTLTDISLTYAVPVQTLAEANGLTTASTIYAGEKILIPGATSALWDTVVELSHGVQSEFIWPLDGDVVSTFGWRTNPVLGTREHHDGIDLDVPEGTVVHASADGKVYFYGEQEGYGNLLILQHTGGYYTLYGHLQSSLVHTGQYVEAGQQVALSGNTGVSSGPHLHFEMRNGEFPIDPLLYLP